MTRVLIVDDSDLARRMLRSVLESGRDVEVCGEAEDGKSAIGKTESLDPDVVVLDVRMPILNGLAATRRIRQFSPRTAVLLVSVDCNRQIVEAAREAGAQGYVNKEDAAKTLVAAVRSVLDGREFFPPVSGQ
jgi:DNA-binding NarL/FixJ family response regulator